MGLNSKLAQLNELLTGDDGAVTTFANASAFLYDCMDNVNWAGFFLLRGDVLVLGPFQGKPACTRIPVGVGVCGTAIARGETIRVDDVHCFDGHIACDAASNSEIVVVLRDSRGEAFGVLDVDSAKIARFGPQDQEFLENAARIVSRAVSNQYRKETGLNDIY